MKSRQDKLKEICAKTHHSQASETKDEKAAREKCPFTYSGFLITNYRGQKEVAHFSSAEGKELSTQSSLSSENILQMICHQQTYPKIIDRGNSLNRKEIMWEHQEGRTNNGKKK